MFCVIYEYDVIPGKENDFKRLWHEIAIDVKELAGSRLHKVMDKENIWVAYAQWPSREIWLAQGPLALKTNRAEMVKIMKETICNKITILLELEVVDDLLVSNIKN